MINNLATQDQIDSINENLTEIKGKGTNQFKIQWGAYLFGYTRAIIDLPHEVGKVTVVNAYAWQNEAHTALSASIDTDGDTPHQIVLRTQQNVQGCYGDVTLRIE